MARCYRQVTPLGSEARGRGRGGACYRQLTPLGSEGWGRGATAALSIGDPAGVRGEGRSGGRQRRVRL